MAVNEAGIAVGTGSTTPSNWTPERVAKLLEIWPGGATAKEAAAIIGGVSRCAVIGKVHRLGLPKRPQDGRGSKIVAPEVLAQKLKKVRDRSAHKQRVRRALARGAAVPEFQPSAPEPQIPAAPAYEGSRNLPFAELGARECRFIEGDAPEYLSCGNQVVGDGSWCRHHQQIVWVKPELRRATAADANRRGRKVSNFTGSYEAA